MDPLPALLGKSALVAEFARHCTGQVPVTIEVNAEANTEVNPDIKAD